MQFFLLFSFLKRVPSQVWLLFIVGLGLLLGGLWVYHRGYASGEAHIQARWDAAVKAVNIVGRDARDEANQTFPIVGGLPDVAPSGPSVKPCRMLDKWDRECVSTGVWPNRKR